MLLVLDLQLLPFSNFKLNLNLQTDLKFIENKIKFITILILIFILILNIDILIFILFIN